MPRCRPSAAATAVPAAPSPHPIDHAESQGKATLAAVASSEGKVIADTLAGCKGRVVPAPSSSSAAPASAGAPASAAVSLGASPALRARLLGLTQSAHAVLFMKGSPGNPRCKFSRAAIASLDATGVPYGSVDILQDPEAREGLKELGGRQTYPQLWVGGKLLGGGDEITALAAAGDLARAIAAKPVDPTAAPANPAHAKCERIVKSAEVMLFIKGQPDAPRCGFSARIVDILRGQGVPFESFDILSDPEVRQGLKECLGKWPTFPQLFVKGEFAGGLDVIKEMVEEGDEPLREQLGLE